MGVWCLPAIRHSCCIHILVKAQMLQTLICPLTRKSTNMVLLCLQVWSSQHKSFSAIEMTWLCHWEIYNWLYENWFCPHFHSLNSILLYHEPSQQMFYFCSMNLPVWGSHVLSFCDWITQAELVHLLIVVVTHMSAGKAVRTWRDQTLWEERVADL